VKLKKEVYCWFLLAVSFSSRCGNNAHWNLEALSRRTTFSLIHQQYLLYGWQHSNNSEHNPCDPPSFVNARKAWDLFVRLVYATCSCQWEVEWICVAFLTGHCCITGGAAGCSRCGPC
jgi:hypothetical protein